LSSQANHHWGTGSPLLSTVRKLEQVWDVISFGIQGVRD